MRLNRWKGSRGALASFDLPSAALVDLFPGIDRHEVRIAVGDISRPSDMVLPLAESLTLAAICQHRQPDTLFEIGTYTGATTKIMAMHSHPSAVTYTLDLPPASVASHQHGLGVGLSPFAVGAEFCESGNRSGIRQLFGDSRTFDFAPYENTMDLVFIDADHTYDFVMNDSLVAFKLIRRGGVIVWDDYRWLPHHSECKGVTQCLHELAGTRPIFQIKGTRLAVYLDAR